MAKEWFQALKWFDRKVVEGSVTHVIQNSKWFPSLAEVRELCVAQASFLRAAGSRVVAQPEPPATPVPDAEVERRKQQCAQWWIEARKQFTREDSF